jgi:hypothetical protein
MALQRLGAYYAPRNLGQATSFYGQAVVFARESKLTGPLIQAAGVWQAFGDFPKAGTLLAEAERDLATNYAPGPDRTHLVEYARWARAEMSLFQGKCDAGLQSLAGGTLDFLTRDCLLACAGASTAPQLRASRARIEKMIPDADLFSQARLLSVAGSLALALHDWRAARQHAEQGLAVAATQGVIYYDLSNLLIQRAALRQDGQAAPAARLSARVLDASARLVFSPPESFNGR